MELISKLNKIAAIVATSNATKEEYSRVINVINDIKEFYDVGKKRLSIENVVEIVRQFYDLPNDYYINKSRKRNLVKARQMCAKILVENTEFTLNEIGYYFGKDHATIIHSRKSISDLINYDRRISLEYDQLISIINNRIIKD
jgi:chromosomal replication initiator protein